ncbi:MAG TPA: lasso RiPP family leader peptide-containing protein [Acidimicrobiia bacterium]|jgi:hypothetical protein
MNEKKIYAKPKLSRWGTVADLTAGGLGLLGDGILGAQSGTSSSTR